MNGERFLRLSKAEKFLISRHALQRMAERAGVVLSKKEACKRFFRAAQLKPWQIALLGYRPAYSQRMRRGIRSWYFRLVIGDREMIAVISEGKSLGQYIWVTTYGRDQQVALQQMASFERVAA